MKVGLASLKTRVRLCFGSVTPLIRAMFKHRPHWNSTRQIAESYYLGTGILENDARALPLIACRKYGSSAGQVRFGGLLPLGSEVPHG